MLEDQCGPVHIPLSPPRFLLFGAEREQKVACNYILIFGGICSATEALGISGTETHIFADLDQASAVPELSDEGRWAG